jgi:hypothetical protein
MPKLLFRIFIFLLVPCLVAHPTLATLFLEQASFSEVHTLTDSPTINEFQEEALSSKLDWVMRSLFDKVGRSRQLGSALTRNHSSHAAETDAPGRYRASWLSAAVILAIDNIGRLFSSKLVYPELDDAFKPILGPLAIGHGPHGDTIVNLLLRYAIVPSIMIGTETIVFVGRSIEREPQTGYWWPILAQLLSSRAGQIGFGLFVGGYISNCLNVFLNSDRINWILFGSSLEMNLADVSIYAGSLILCMKIWPLAASPDSSVNSTWVPHIQINPKNNLSLLRDA